MGMFSCFWELGQLFSVTGRLGMTLATRIVAVCFHVKPKTGLVVETRIDAEKVK